VTELDPAVLPVRYASQEGDVIQATYDLESLVGQARRVSGMMSVAVAAAARIGSPRCGGVFSGRDEGGSMHG
jgi:hypothetical protein